MHAETNILGIDAGSVAVGVAMATSDRRVVQTAYRVHHGDVEGTLLDILTEFELTKVAFAAATESAPRSLAATKRYNNEIAVITACRHFHPGIRGMLLVGGEKFSFSAFDRDGHFLGSASNTSCAAGTGSFLDQQAGRLSLAGIEALSEKACASCGTCPKIATRCAVFAKTDLIHAQQEGYQVDEISNGLCRGLAKNIVDTLSLARRVEGEVVFCGGVSKNQAVARHIAELSGLRLTIPKNGHVYGAIGAAFALLDDLSEAADEVLNPTSLQTPEDLLLPVRSKAKEYYYPPLQLQLSTYPDFNSEEQYDYRDGKLPVEVDMYQSLEIGGEQDVYLGIDVGSTSTKAVLLDRRQDVLVGLYTRTSGRPLVAVQDIFRAIDAIGTQKKCTFKIIACGTTGSGRKFIGRLVGADAVVDEITAHARAAYQLNPQVDTIIEIGGQDAKFTTMKDGRVTFSTMNNVCAAGTGSFIEEQAARLGCPIREYSGRAENVRAPLASDRCTVFMERDINHHLSEGYSVDEVLASALHSVRENYLLKVANEKHIGKTILFQGATAKNRALVAAFEQGLGRPIIVSRFCHLTGALGTALILRDEWRNQKSGFAGLAIYQEDIAISSEICDLCNNHCKISVANIGGTKVAYGFLCGRDYDNKSYVERNNGAIDLLRERRKVSRFRPEAKAAENIVIGLPAAVHMVEDLLFWQRFFDLLGIQTLSSERYDEALKVGKTISRAEFCAPVASMHGHTAWLLERVDYVFLPVYLENKDKEARRQYCYYTQFLSSLTSLALEGGQDRILRPVIKYLYTSFHAKIQLYRMLRKISRRSLSFYEISTAYDRAVDYDQAYRLRLKEMYREWADRSEDVKVVFVGRPYTVLSASLNCGIPEIFADLGVNAFYQDMLTYEAQQSEILAPLLQELHWEYASKILEAATVVAGLEGVYPVYITSFRCSPDSFAVEYFKAVMEAYRKPYLILELDEHDSSVGYETRIEAAVRTFRNHRSQIRPAVITHDYTPLYPNHVKDLRRQNVIFPNWDRLTCSLLVATLRREGYNAILMEETEHSIRESLKHNTGQCIPLNAVAQGYMDYIASNQLDPADTLLWVGKSTLACNIKLYPHHIKQILNERGGGFEKAGVYVGQLTFSDISLRATMNAYFAQMFGGMLRKVACCIRPYEVDEGNTDRVLDKSIKILCDAFEGKREKEDALVEIISRFEWIETRSEVRPKVAIFGDLYTRDNRVMNQGLIRYIEKNGGEVITTPYLQYAKMIAPSYFRKWFNEGRYLDLLSSRTLLATMSQMEKTYYRIFNRILGETEPEYTDNLEGILAKYAICPENTGESMDNIVKIHYIKKQHPDVALFVQASPALCCASLVTEAMREIIEKKTGVPVVSVTYDGTGGFKNDVIIPYLRFSRRIENQVKPSAAARMQTILR